MVHNNGHCHAYRLCPEEFRRMQWGDLKFYVITLSVVACY